MGCDLIILTVNWQPLDKNNLIFYPYYRRLEDLDKLLIQENIYDNCY